MAATPDDEERLPLVANDTGTPSAADAAEMNAIQQAISQTYRSTADLANHLPTGTVLAFHVLSPAVTDLGRCTAAERALTSVLLALCALSCFLLSFTDSFADPVTHRLRYGFATARGLWMIDGLGPPPDNEAKKRRLAGVDFLHALTSLVVFAGVALLDSNVVACFYPAPSEDVRQVLTVLPVAIGVLGGSLLVTFPTNRHGIGFPVTATPATAQSR